MSVINQMLRDLDARQASEQERVGLPPRLRTLPERKLSHAQSLRMLLAGIGLGVLLAGVVAWLWQPAATPAPSLAPSAASPPAAQAVLPAPTAMAPATAAPDTKLADLSEMKLSLLLSLGQAAEQAASRPAAPPPASPKTKETIASPAPAAKGSHTAEASEAAGAQGQIDKRNKSGPGGELAEAEYRKGMQLVKHGEALAALPLFRHALELDPLHARARQALLSVLVGNKAWDEAKQVAAAGLALDPAQSGWAMILARLQFEQNDAAGALATLEKHAVQAANDADYQSLYAYLLQKQQRPAEAAERFRAALARRPTEGRWWFGLGVALEQSGRAEEARQAYAKAKESGNLPAELITAVESKLR